MAVSRRALALLLAGAGAVRGANEDSLLTLWFAFEEYGNDDTCTPGVAHSDQAKSSHRHLIAQPYWVSDWSGGDAKPEGLPLFEVSTVDGEAAIRTTFGVAMPWVLARCFSSEKLSATHEGKEYFAFGCGRDEEMYLLGFDDIDACRDAFYCSVTNPLEVMQSEEPVPQGDPVASCALALGPDSGNQLPIVDDKTVMQKSTYSDLRSEGDEDGLECLENCYCTQWPFSAETGSSSFRIYKGCIVTASTQTIGRVYNEPTVMQYDPRGTELTTRSKAGIAVAILLSLAVVSFLFFLVLRPIVLARRRRKEAPPLERFSNEKSESAPGDV